MSKLGNAGIVICFAIALSANGCVSKYRAALQDRDAQIQMHKEEITSLRAALDESRARERLLQGVPINPSLVPAAASKADDTELVNTRTQLDGTGVETDRRNGRIVLTLPEEITFASGKASLSSQGKSALKKVSELLKKEYATRIIWVEGHTDNEPIRKSGYRSNRHLSVERANAVLDSLKTEAGIEDSRLVLVGHGEFSPITDNSTSEGRKRNRRVEIVIGD